MVDVGWGSNFKRQFVLDSSKQQFSLNMLIYLSKQTDIHRDLWTRAMVEICKNRAHYVYKVYTLLDYIWISFSTYIHIYDFHMGLKYLRVAALSSNLQRIYLCTSRFSGTIKLNSSIERCYDGHIFWTVNSYESSTEIQFTRLLMLNAKRKITFREKAP